MKKRQAIVLVFLLGLIFPVFADAAPEITFSSNAHVVWMIVASLLVLFMTLPGITLFYGGMVQRKNVLSIYAQCVVIAAIVSIVWFFIGYAIAFGSNNHELYNLKQYFLGLGGPQSIGNTVKILFEMAFAIITTAIIVGGFAERMKFAASLIFTPIWLIAVYCPIAHWIWGNDGWLHKLGAIDFAGGAVVHINAGIAGLIAAIMVGQRRHRHNDPHSLSLVTIGTSIIWFGWFGFNGGSAMNLSSATLALLNTQLAPTAAAIGWMVTEWMHRKKPSARGLLFGVISGLVMLTPMAGLCSPLAAVIAGLIAGFVCYWAVNLKKVIGYDDALDAFGIHGIAGILGALGTGITANTLLHGAGYILQTTMMQQLGIQLLEVLTVLIWSGCVSFVILWLIEKIIGLRVEESVEVEGLDYHEHGEQL